MRLSLAPLLLLALFIHQSVADNDIGKDVDTVDVKMDDAAVVETIGEEAKSEKKKISSQDISFYHGFLASFSVIVVSELGDKTWFIAVIMSMRHSRLTVFSGAMGALALMTVLSACLGWVTQVIPRAVTYYLSTALFALFGLKMLHEGWTMSPNEGQEGFEEAQAEVAKREGELDASKFEMLEGGGVAPQSETKKIFLFTSRIFIEAFTLTFVAEWGDRSQLTTIILGARENIAGVIGGGVLGHALCTGIAVIGGKIVAQRISVRTVTLIGGVVFLLFALSALFINDIESAVDSSLLQNSTEIGNSTIFAANFTEKFQNQSLIEASIQTEI
ncbi:hypothetical protein L3Y34_000203 [Caenorhabditis briggsae]|uniref:GDT1 family protein n=1 Tax=Caenorhabditis briggsae TaxID=6238 RepID=A0AAE9D8L8_CAEBR|nr:hypothetical protein L3Y34_000203 [Caenorhabditis briggsae]